MPFTVKSIFTPRFSLLMVSLSTLVVVGLNLVVFFATDIVFIYSPQYNATIASLKFTNFYHQFETQFSDGVKILRILLTFLPFFVLIFSSGITMYFLRTSSSLIRKAKHTKISTSGLSTKEKQVVKMLLVILGLFIGNLFPRILFYVVQFSLPEFYFGKRLNNVFNLTFSGILVLDFVNHTSNLFVFLTMSTNFRVKFIELFPFSRRLF
ncbi:uncharacterized protein LOC131930664 [Physella acuta]|uniref:uncharacterized protein LOC131930664 n=1 Tax=Physella acuta TaxID=109671 RepID=UPI0027DCB256|nr:uncharacterized protein LOC131930664 [Physella acuta]